MDATDPRQVKACCAVAYSGEWARLLLGDSFHPGGVGLTERLGALLGLEPGMRLLDVASGAGASAIFLAQRFGCDVVGVDYSAASVRAATRAAEAAGVDHLVHFEPGDAESLPVADHAFDAIVCECAFCTFPNKHAAVAEFARVLRPGGRVGLSDLTRVGSVPDELQGLLAWIACIADAQPVDEYIRYLVDAGLSVETVEPHDDALRALVGEIRGKLLGAELFVKLKRIALPLADFERAKGLARAADAAVKAGRFGYAIVTAHAEQESNAPRSCEDRAMTRPQSYMRQWPGSTKTTRKPSTKATP
jgi:ubiquinone/menaquinone biosynthesis C-methylase UbiE